MFQSLRTYRRIIFWEPLGSPGLVSVDGTEPALAASTPTWPPTVAQAAIYDRLSEDDDLLTLLGGTAKIYDYVPQNTSFPYITMNISPWEDRGNHTNEGFSCTFQIDVWYQPGGSSYHGRGNYRIQQIQKRVDELLHKYNLSVSGWNTLILRRSLVDIITDQDGVTKHGIQQFKLYLGGL